MNVLFSLADVVRSSVPKIELDDVFTTKDEISETIKPTAGLKEMTTSLLLVKSCWCRGRLLGRDGDCAPTAPPCFLPGPCLISSF